MKQFYSQMHFSITQENMYFDFATSIEMQLNS